MRRTTSADPAKSRKKWRGIRGLRYNEDGVSAVEFALIAPVMLLIYLGCIELSLLMRADRRVSSTSAAIGDLTARLATFTDDDLEEIKAAATVMMQPQDMSEARIRLTSIVDSGDGVAKVAWSDAWGLGIEAYAEDSVLSVPDGIVSSPGSVILAEVSYDHKSSFGDIVKTEKTVEDRFYLRPRRVSEIERVRGDAPTT